MIEEKDANICHSESAKNKKEKYKNVCRSEIANRLKERSKEMGMTQNQIADLIPISRQMVNSWFAGKRDIPLYHLLRMCDILKCDVDHLLGVLEEKKHVIKHISDYTGLCNVAVEDLMNWSKWYTEESVFRFGHYEEDLTRVEHSMALDTLNRLFLWSMMGPLMFLIRQYVWANNAKAGFVCNTKADNDQIRFDDVSDLLLVAEPETSRLRREPVGARATKEIFKTAIMRSIEKLLDDFSADISDF